MASAQINTGKGALDSFGKMKSTQNHELTKYMREKTSWYFIIKNQGSNGSITYDGYQIENPTTYSNDWGYYNTASQKDVNIASKEEAIFMKTYQYEN